MIAFLWIPELVEHLLTFLDAPSILNLARAHDYTVHVLQKPLVWEKVIRRACPFGREEEDRSLLNTTIVERKKDQVRALVGLLELLEDRDNHHLDLLKLICERFPPLRHGQQYVQLSDSRIGPSCSVSPLGFLLLEEVETSQRLAEDHVVRVHVDNLREPLLSVLSRRANIQDIVVKSVKNSTDRKFTRRNSTESILQDLPQNSMKYHKSMLHHPLSSKGVYSFIIYVNFYSTCV